MVRADSGAAHSLRQYKGKCERLHGHNWQIDVYLAGPALNSDGMVIDFIDAKAAIREVLKRFDHYYLNEVPPFDKLNPTSENLARILCEAVQAQLPRDVRVLRVTAWESANCCATYLPE
jgi:6-pyruvoyltetrahydropterin/6-carboxytetrahydropterin synthase